MPSILDISAAGLNAASARIANAASSIVNSSSTASVTKSSGANVANTNLDAAVVDIKIDQISYAANATVIKTAEKLEKALLDIKT